MLNFLKQDQKKKELVTGNEKIVDDGIDKKNEIPQKPGDEGALGGNKSTAAEKEQV